MIIALLHQPILRQMNTWHTILSEDKATAHVHINKPKDQAMCSK